MRRRVGRVDGLLRLVAGSADTANVRYAVLRSVSIVMDRSMLLTSAGHSHTTFVPVATKSSIGVTVPLQGAPPCWTAMRSSR